MLNNQIRIIAGKWRGSKLTFPSLPGLRPTSDRLREAVFSWLQPKIVGATCLDAFAGSGALGFEALSRGAKNVVMLDQSAAVIQVLTQHAERLDAENAEIIKTDALGYFEQKPSSFDLIFLDPPFGKALLARCLAEIIEHHLLAKGGLIYLESEHPIELPAGFEVFREKKMGDVFAALFRLVS